MKLSTRILLFLFIFAFVPMLFAVAINLPLVLDRVALFYREAILQNLRADFRDLDQHLASRNEMAKLLAKLPAPGAMMGTDNPQGEERIALARVQYANWINRILAEQLDILDILFVDAQAVNRFWLSRNANTRRWEATARPPYLPPVEQITKVLHASGSMVKFSPVRVDPNPESPGHEITLQLLAPISNDDGTAILGAVIMTVDIGGLMRKNPETLWVLADGKYLQVPGLPTRDGMAFDDFSDLQALFAADNIALWEGAGGESVIWVPLLRTESNQALWVGRRVDEQPLQTLRNTLVVRVLSIMLALIALIALGARWIATRLESAGNELIQAVGQVLEGNQPVVFSWHGSPEIKQLGEDLSVLASEHASTSRTLAAHTAELEESNRYKSEFLANVSHELKTPLNSILSLSKLLLKQDNDLSAEGTEQVQVINKAGEDLRRLIDNILDLSKIEAGQLEMHVASVDLAQLAGELLELMQPQFVEKGLQLTLLVDADIPAQIETDADKLRQILKNFLGNAVKFTSTGEVVLELQVAEAPYAVRLQVRDGGIGIPADKHRSIFEAFKQADGSTSRRFGGTGLGLSISNQLATMLGGEITLESEPGKGALFSLLLPASQSAVAAERVVLGTSVSAPRSDNAIVVPDADFTGSRVLLVDQDVQQLLHLSQLLESWNMHVLVASDAEEAGETLLEEPDCHLVLLAHGMPDMDSYATIQTMRTLITNRPLTVIAINAVSGSLAGADFNLSAPADAQALLLIIQKISES